MLKETWDVGAIDYMQIWMRYYLLPFNIQTTMETHVKPSFLGVTHLYIGGLKKKTFIFHGHLGSSRV